jgi:hypothetical protein
VLRARVVHEVSRVRSRTFSGIRNMFPASSQHVPEHVLNEFRNLCGTCSGSCTFTFLLQFNCCFETAIQDHSYKEHCKAVSPWLCDLILIWFDVSNFRRGAIPVLQFQFLSLSHRPILIRKACCVRRNQSC